MLWFMALALCVQSTEKTTVTFGSTVELETVVRDGKGETTRLLNLARREKFVQTPVDPKTVKIECQSSLLQKSGTDTPIEEKPTALAGRSFVATRTESGWSVRDQDGQAPPNEGVNLGAWNDIGRLLPPTGEVKAGDKWSVEGKDLLALVFPTAMQEATGKLDCACESAEGGKANIVFSGQITGKGKDEGGGSITFAVKTGRLTYDLGKKRAASVLLSGSFEATRDMLDVIRKPGTGANIGNEEERRKVGEITVKSHKLEVEISFE
ncbi:MAG TPA: hypothetical protein VNM14_14800 [Planctomycetota bacterium]|nr:hypothetical protein [Planctomycetota bacterium]